eukprot:3126206-Prymnesium_polylepis.1
MRFSSTSHILLRTRASGSILVRCHTSDRAQPTPFDVRDDGADPGRGHIEASRGGGPPGGRLAGHARGRLRTKALVSHSALRQLRPDARAPRIRHHPHSFS